MLDKIKAWLTTQYDYLRRGGVLRIGPLSVVRTPHIIGLLSRLRHAEHELARSSTILPATEEYARTLFDADVRRSVVFLHHSYYNFLYLAAALRKRGWDAIAVSIDDPSAPDQKYFHGEDLSVFDPDPQRYQEGLDRFFEEVAKRFKMVHFYGRGRMSFYPASFDRSPRYEAIPSDFLRLRQLGVKIGYSVCGCLDGVAQSSVHQWSGGACDRCVWQTASSVCSDNGNLAWGHKIHMVADLIATEGFPALDWQATEKAFREPLTTALDPELWCPDLVVPDRYKLKRDPSELIVYHAVGNIETRAREGRNIKGSGAVLAAVDRLRAEGVKVRIEFVTNVPSEDVRFIQVQADVIIDQLNYGRYGATAREALMLGKPTICYINKQEPVGAERLESIETCPLVSATEDTVYTVLKGLLEDEGRRRAVGEASRAFALKWHSADACAERFEAVYDRLTQGMPPTCVKAVSA